MRLLGLALIGWCAVVTATDETCREKIAQLVRDGIQSELAVGYHGTGIGAIETALVTGAVPADGTGYLYFFPNLAHPRMNGPDRGFHVGPGTLPEYNRSFPYLGAEEYAVSSAIDHAVLKRLNVPMSTDAIRALGGLGDFPHAEGYIEGAKFFEKLGVSVSQVRQAENIVYGSRHSGLILGLRPDVFDRFTLSNAVGDDEGLRIHVPDGLPLQYLQGIVPLGWRERLFLNRLQAPPK